MMLKLKMKMKMKRWMTLKGNLVVGTKNIEFMEYLGVVGKKPKLVVGMGPGQIGGVYIPSLCVCGGMLDIAFSLNGNGFATGGASSEEGSLQQQWCELSI
jgi:hypothetical protein